jgi:hypothetical protein
VRDHPEIARDVVVKFGARPMNQEAADALTDPGYRAGMDAYSERLGELLDPVWEREIVSREPNPIGVSPRPAPQPVTAAQPAPGSANGQQANGGVGAQPAAAGRSPGKKSLPVQPS